MDERLNYLTIDQLNQIPWLVHGFGLAGFILSDLEKDVRLNSFQPVEMSQQHSAKVFFLEDKPGHKLSGDGLVTATPDLLLLIKTADCLPLFLVDTEHQAVAAVHCGWRGTYQKISVKAFELMQQKLGSRAQNILAALGPCIEQSCYEVGGDVYEMFSQAGFPLSSIFLTARKHDKFYLDLRAANFWLLTAVLSIPEKNIFQINLCTFCRGELLSYRRERVKSQRLINFIGIKNLA
ncbi:MAG: peptidoglycan editing factor PgeF [Candidatus Aminicenantes bacterium]|nr:peptidoglycan editing factor PgeF [Candidatus Aminicenantes bacterium]